MPRFAKELFPIPKMGEAWVYLAFSVSVQFILHWEFPLGVFLIRFTENCRGDGNCVDGIVTSLRKYVLEANHVEGLSYWQHYIARPHYILRGFQEQLRDSLGNLGE